MAGPIDVSRQGTGEVIIVCRIVLPDFRIERLSRLYGALQMMMPEIVESLVGLRLIIRFPVVRALQEFFEGMRVLIEGAIIALVIEDTELAVHL